MRFWIVYALGVAASAVALAAYVYHRAYQPPRCLSGHCPDPGSMEYLAGMASNVQHAPETALTMGVLTLLLGALGAGLILALRALVRL